MKDNIENIKIRGGWITEMFGKDYEFVDKYKSIVGHI